VSFKLLLDSRVILIWTESSNAETAVRKMLIAAAQAAESTTLSVSKLVLDDLTPLDVLD
jgi:hypothetical protein